MPVYAARGERLMPPEAFSTLRGSSRLREECGVVRSRDELGRNALSVRRRIRSSCAGWVRRPTAADFYDAVRAQAPDDWQQCLISMWIREATDAELALAWIEEAYTFRELVAAVHRAGAPDVNPWRNRDLNRLVPE